MLTRGLFLFALTALAACGQVSPRFATSAYPDEKKAVQPKALTREPVTVTVPVEQDLAGQMARAIGGKTPRSVALSLRGVKMPDGWNPRTAVHVFVNKPKAAADTPTDDPSFVFAFHLSPLDPEDPQNFGMDLGPALARLKWTPDQPVKVTFVVMPPKNVELPKDLKVPFEELVVSVPDR